jgi:hypothetical protein
MVASTSPRRHLHVRQDGFSTGHPLGWFRVGANVTRNGPVPFEPDIQYKRITHSRNRVRTTGGVAQGCVAPESSSVPVGWSDVAGQRGSVGSSGVDCSGKGSSARWLRTRSLRVARMSSSAGVNKLMKC